MRPAQSLLSLPHLSLIRFAILGLAIVLPAAAGSAGVTTGDVVPANPAAWDWDTSPRIGETAVGTLTISGGNDVSCRGGYFGYLPGSEGTGTVSGFHTYWSLRNGLYVGFGGMGTLNIQASGWVSSETGCLGHNSGSEGTATVSGSGTRWSLTLRLYVGSEGTGTLNIQNSGVVSSEYGYLGHNSGSQGTATVNGSDTGWYLDRNLYVGFKGTGTLNIQDFGVVKSDYGYLGYNSGSQGTSTVSGIRTTWETDRNFTVGNHGTGTLNILDGGLVKNRQGYLGRHSGSEGTATVSGDGSTWEMDYAFFLGWDGTGTLNVHDGGLVSVGTMLSLGGYRTGTGTLNVHDGGLVSVGTTLSLGGYGTGTGTLNVHDGGLVSVGTATFVNPQDTGSKIVFDGGSLETGSIYATPEDLQGVGTIRAKGWVLDADVTINTTTLVHSLALIDPTTGTDISVEIDQTGPDLGTVGAGYRGAGTLTIDNGGLVRSSAGWLGYRPGSEGTATVIGAGSTWEMSDNFSVGHNGMGTLNIRDGGLVSVGEDALVNSRSMLSFGIGSGGSGLLDVGGDVELNGELAVTLLDGYMPGPGDQFTLIEADGPEGISGLSYDELMTALPALDGLLYWGSDYVEGSSELTFTVVPEPSTIVLLITASLVGLLRFRRKRGHH